MKKERRPIFNYISEQFIGRFTGFIIGLWASSLVSHYFTTRTFRNLWGLTARKTVVSKQTFSNLEWVASIVIGYIVFEIVLRVIKNKITPWLTKSRFRFLRWMVEKGWGGKIRNLR